MADSRPGIEQAPREAKPVSELATIGRIDRLLMAMTPAGRARALAWLASRYAIGQPTGEKNG